MLRRKYLYLIVYTTAVLTILLIALLTYKPKEEPGTKCGPYRNDKVVRIDSSQINTEVADNSGERTKGLSGRPCIEASQGMLFVFDKPGQYVFWMKDMKFPIDIVWIDSSQRVVDLDINVAPSTYPNTFVSEKPAQYILELQANRSKALSINIGTIVNF